MTVTGDLIIPIFLAIIAILNFAGLWNQLLLPVTLNTGPKNYVLTRSMASFDSQARYLVDLGQFFAGVCSAEPADASLSARGGHLARERHARPKVQARVSLSGARTSQR